MCLNLDQWFRRNVVLRHFLSAALKAILFGGVGPYVQFSRGHSEEYFCEINLNLEMSH